MFLYAPLLVERFDLPSKTPVHLDHWGSLPVLFSALVYNDAGEGCLSNTREVIVERGAIMHEGRILLIKYVIIFQNKKLSM